MIGAIAGDMIGSRFEWHNIHTKEFELFTYRSKYTDDSVMTIALADAILDWDEEGRPSYDRLSQLAVEKMRLWGRKYPSSGYGGHFIKWLFDDSMGPYNSCGNGSAMRIGAVGYAARNLDECIRMSDAVTKVTHNHPDGIMGARATAAQVFLALRGKSLEELREFVTSNYYAIEHDVAWYQKDAKWIAICDGTCQPAFQSLYEATSFEDAMRNCMSVGGDSDTIGAICGPIAQAVFGVPEKIVQEVRLRLEEDMLDVLDRFEEKYMN